jgi:hypothetical protein
MGAWGNGPLENDSAVDWLCVLEKFLKESIGNEDPDISIAAIHIVTLLNLEPGATKYGTCPLGYKFPTKRIIESSLERIEDLIKNESNYQGDFPSLTTLNELKDRVVVMNNKLLAEGIIACNDKNPWKK